jgi:hypothetical protein
MVGFISDILLNDLSRMYPLSSAIGSLRPYFEHKTITVAAIYAGLTILVATLLLAYVMNTTHGFMFPRRNTQLPIFIVVAYALGYAIDVIIDKTKLFGPTLEPFYRTAGAGHWGAIAFVFSLLMSYGIQKTIVPLL